MAKCIWYVSKYVSPPGNGTAGGRGYLLMKEFARMGHNALIITSDSNHLVQPPGLTSPYLLQVVDGIQLWWVRTAKYRVAKSMRRIFSWINFEWRLLLMSKSQLPRPDVVVVSSLSLLTVLNGFWLKKRYGCRLIFEIRDIWPLTLTEEGGFGRRNPLVIGLAWIERLGYRYADDIVGTMPNLAEHVRNILGYDKRVECIPMGVDEEALIDALAIPDNYAAYLPFGKFIVAHVGSVGITNALNTFLDCAEALIENSAIHFLVVGEGDLLKHYRAKYGKLPNLTFAPKVPKQMVPSILARCDLLYFSVHASKVWNFGQSLNKVVDYMLAGKPIIASYTGYPSMINEAECGSYVPVEDVLALRSEILRYNLLPELERRAMGMKGRDWILAHRSYRTLARNYLKIMFPALPKVV